MNPRIRQRSHHRPSKVKGTPLILMAPLFAVLFPAMLFAGDWYVDASNPNCPGTGTLGNPYCTIQNGINAAVDGDTVHVAPGVYVENVDFMGKAITVKGSAGAAVTTIDGNRAGSVVTFQSGETSSSVLESITITNGLARRGGGIVCINNSSPTITHTNICSNLAYWHSTRSGGNGGGIFCNSSSPTITNSTVSGNRAAGGYYSSGGGICGGNSSPTITHTTVSGNSADYGGGIVLAGSPSAMITDTTVSGNTAYYSGGGIFCNSSSPTITNSTVSGNTAFDDGGGIRCIRNSAPTITNTTLSGNAAYVGGGISASGSSSPTITSSILWADSPPEISLSGGGAVTATYSDIQGGFPGTSNINLAPQFVSPATGNYRLQPTSPCIDTGDPISTPTGKDLAGNPRFLDGLLDRTRRVDMGSHEFANVQLEITGSPIRGGQLDFDTTGTSGLPFVRFLAVSNGEFALPPFGPLFFDPLSYWTVVHSGLIPSQASVPLPLAMFTPLPLIFQDLAIAPGNGAGNTSNPVEIVIE